MATAPKSPRIALDANFLLDLAAQNDRCWECLELLKSRNLAPEFIVTSTVLHELSHLALYGNDGQNSEDARLALSSLLTWNFKPVDFIPVGHGIIDCLSDEMRRRELVPYEERNDSLIIAEAALLNCDILISSDAHITSIDPAELKAFLEEYDVSGLVVLWPQAIIKSLR